MLYLNRLTYCSLLIGLICLCACEVDTKIASNGENPPTFKLSGSGNLVSFWVMEVPPENQTQAIQRESDRNILLWEILPQGRDDAIRRIPEITYGTVPSRFVQKFPANGSAPVQLIRGKIYEIGAVAYNANGGQIWIKVEDGKTVEVPIPASRPPATGSESPANMRVR
jgi:hypothetical protein